MWTRVVAWGTGTVTGFVLARVVHPAALEGIEFPACCALAMMTGLLGEIVLALRSLRTSVRVATLANARLADGRVHVTLVQGIHGEPNERDRRFQSFRALADRHPARPGALATGRELPPLRGRVAIVSVFLGRDGRGWSDAEIAEAHAATIHAGTWIEREAIRWGAPVNIALADTYFAVVGEESDAVEVAFVPEGDGMGPLEPGAVTKGLIGLSRAAKLLGFRDAADWMAKINPRIDADFHVWLLHARQAGRSLAIPLDQTELSGVSLAICYARESSFPEPLTGRPFSDPVTIVHELLHLFGASDKYGVPLCSFAGKSVSSRDIMRLSETRLSRSRIDSLTAREIGWPSAH